MKCLLVFIFTMVAGTVHALSCEGKIIRVNQWSDGQDNKVNFKLKSSEGSMWVQTKTKEQVSMVLLSLASQNHVKVYWSCGAPNSWFGTLGRSLYTLFQIMTLESWSMGISRPVMEQFPYAWAFFIPFILIATFTMLNLFIAIIVNAMQRYTSEEREETATIIHESQEHIESSLHEEVVQLRAELKVIKQLLLETRDNQSLAPK